MRLATPFGHRFGLALTAICCCGLLGCRAKQGQLPTAQVTGRVTLRGVPLTRGEIKFFPVQVSGEGVRVAYGTLDAEGRYCLSTYRQGDGAILGDHRIAVESSEETSPGFGKTEAMARQSKWLIPARFADPQTSGLTAHVEKGRNTFDFDLKE